MYNIKSILLFSIVVLCGSFFFRILQAYAKEYG
jgi:hypothetical protein